MTQARTSILWRRLDQPGHDSARLTERTTGAILDGTAVFSEAGLACRLNYRIECDTAWRTVSASVRGWLDATEIDLAIEAGPARAWTLNGRPCPNVQGCEDVDLSFTPATNLLPIRRAALGVGGRAAVRAAWLVFPAVALEPLDQIYERVAERRYDYQSHGGAFRAILDTNAVGFVTEYSGLWRVEDAG
jgi:uncharacterized protein